MNEGNKAENLRILAKNGFNVPAFFVLPPHLKDRPDEIKEILKKKIKPNKRYAIRSSGLKEDLPNFSFAGQYYTALNIRGSDDIFHEVGKCYDSVNSRTVRAYLKQNDLDADDVRLAVIVQEMVQSEFSGIAFSVNPLTGNDTEIVLEVAPGLGEAIVSGRVNPQEYRYDWYEEKFTKTGKGISQKIAKELCEQVLRIQTLFGYPCDVEFALRDDTIYMLQARAITKILYGGIKDQWTTADFKDGGVSSTVCYPFMWSLYEYIWETSFRDFLHSSLMLEKKHLTKLGDMFYGRPYWNLTKTKIAMAKAPGFKERDFDNDLGVAPTYDGDGVTTTLTPKSLVNAVRILMKNSQSVKSRLKNNERLKNELIRIYDFRLAHVSDDAKAWKELVFDDYFKSESTYFGQIFINTVTQSIYKEALLKHVSNQDYVKLLMGLHDISHLRPYQFIWDLSRKGTTSNEDIADFLEQFGYHSTRELDVTYPHFSEEPEVIKKLIQSTAKLPDKYSPDREIAGQQKVFQKTLSKIPPKLRPTVERMRTLLWWREELRDVSTRFYYLIRLYTVALARRLHKEKILEQPDDIWYLKIKDVRAYLDGRVEKSELRKIINRNKKYYASFRNFTPENEIGHAFDTSNFVKKDHSALGGIGCSNGSVTGKARVIADISAIDEIQPGEILVTKFTDTGWTSKFAVLGGVVTEYGGILCHAAIVSREYGIPCVVCATDIMRKVRTGDTITMNGETGEIRKDNP